MGDNRDISTIHQSKGGRPWSHENPGDDEDNEQRTLSRNKGMDSRLNLTAHPINTPSQRTLSTRHIKHTLLFCHTLPHTLSTHPSNPLYHRLFSTHSTTHPIKHPLPHILSTHPIKHTISILATKVGCFNPSTRSYWRKYCR